MQPQLLPGPDLAVNAYCLPWCRRKEEATVMNVLECTTAISFKNILFLTDLTPASEAAFSYAVALARHFDARLYPAHVLFPFIPSEVEAIELPKLMDKAETETRQQL